MAQAKKTAAIVAVVALLVGAAGWWARARRTPSARPVTVATGMAAPPAPSVPRPSNAPARAVPMTLSAAVADRDPTAENGLFEGRVIDWASGKGVPRAEVTFSVDGATAAVRTDEEGRFQFAPAKPGRCMLALVTAAEYLPYAPEWGHSAFDLVARPGMRVRDLTLYLVPALDYVGTVVGPDGKPVEGAAVTLLAAAQGEQALVPIADHFTSDRAGTFHFHAPDEALLEARHPAYGPGRARLDGAVQTSHRLTIRLAAKDAAEPLGGERITGRVVDAAGAPVAGALVHATPGDDHGDGLHASAQALADAAGRFALEGLDAVRYTVGASRAGYAPASVERVSASAHDVVIGLHRGAVLAGRVLSGAGGDPVPSFTILVARRDGPIKEVSVAVRSVIDPEGRFTVPDLEPGALRVRAVAHAHAPSPPVDVTIPEPPAEPAPIALVLTRGGRLTGRVVDPAGPVEHARVSIENAFGDVSTTVAVAASTVTDEHGQFELGGIPPGPRSILVAAYRHHIRILSGVRFTDEATVGPLTVDLTPTQEGEEPRIELAGVGAKLAADGDGLRVEAVIPGGGAEAAGLVPGDVVLAVDGAPTATLGMDGAVQRIRGPEGSTVVLTVRRASGAVVDVPTLRRRIRA